MWLPLFFFFILSTVVLAMAANARQATIPELSEGMDAPPFMTLPLAFFLESLLPDKFRSFETERLMPRILMLHGPGDAGLRMQVHLSVKCLHFVLGLHVSLLLLMAGSARPTLLFLLPAGGVVLWLLSDRQLDKAYKARCEQLEQEFPDFVCQVALLTGAGLHVRQALRRIVTERGAAQALLCREVSGVLAEMDGGIAEAQAWTELAERCRTREIASLCGIFIQHARQGGNGLARELRHMASDSWEARKHAARRRGEEASSKLMIPVAILFVAVLLVSVAPAFMGLGGIF